jgi:copper chaperone CopZ
VAARRIEGVTEAEFHYPGGTGTVTYDTTRATTSQILAELSRATGFEADARDDSRKR